MLPASPPTETTRSLSEVHSTVGTGQITFWRRILAFGGPAYLVSVGYMDPGNWATDLEGGARFGYDLLWVLVMSNLMAILLQTLSARLGIATGRDLAQACRESYSRPVAIALWALCEIAIVACDLAEVLGAAIALNLLFGMPLIAGVLVTAADTLLLLWLQRFGIRMMEAFVLVLVGTIAICFAIEIQMAQPVFAEVLRGLNPKLTAESLYVAIGILGATVMPHNLYLHSALVQTRQIAPTLEGRRVACRYNLLDCVIALNGALFVNAGILILSGAVFHSRGIVVNEIQQAHLLLAPLLGTSAASVIFAVALLCSGQSSTLTGTLAGQIVMEGFLNFRMRPWMRRILTRSLAIVPAVVTIHVAGDASAFKLLILSQVVLSMQLPFAVIPLIRFTSDRGKMAELVNPLWVKCLAWLSAVVIVGLNLRLVWSTLGGWFTEFGASQPWLVPALSILGLALVLLLGYVAVEPLFARRRASLAMPAAEILPAEIPAYRRILIPLDHSDLDRQALRHGAALARQHGARIYLIHVEEGVTSQVYGNLASTAEVREGAGYLESVAATLRAEGIEVETVVAHSANPKREIVRLAELLRPDLLIMGAHGHSTLKDWIFGNTIEPVRHALEVPILIVRDS